MFSPWYDIAITAVQATYASHLSHISIPLDSLTSNGLFISCMNLPAVFYGLGPPSARSPKLQHLANILHTLFLPPHKRWVWGKWINLKSHRLGPKTRCCWLRPGEWIKVLPLVRVRLQWVNLDLNSMMVACQTRRRYSKPGAQRPPQNESVDLYPAEILTSHICLPFDSVRQTLRQDSTIWNWKTWPSTQWLVSTLSYLAYMPRWQSTRQHITYFLLIARTFQRTPIHIALRWMRCLYNLLQPRIYFPFTEIVAFFDAASLITDKKLYQWLHPIHKQPVLTQTCT